MATERLHKTIAELEMRLKSVLRIAPESNEKTSTPSALTPLAEKIRRVSESVCTATARISDIINRIEA